MAFIKIWERYFVWEFAKIFFLFLICFYGLYILIDYSSHASSFHYHHIRFRWYEFAVYYFCEFISRAEILVPFALLVASVHTLCQLNARNELVALLASGIKLQTLLRPFVCIGLLFTLLLYLNEDLLIPMALKKIKSIDSSHTSARNNTNDHPSVQHVALEDKSMILFQHYNSQEQFFFDAYWIRSIDDIYRIKYLYPYSDVPVGHYVDHLHRSHSQALTPKESFTLKSFPEMIFNKASLLETLALPEEYTLTELRDKAPSHHNLLSAKESQIVTTFNYRLAMPWLALLAIIGPAPFCLRFTRHLPTFFIYCASIFGLIGFYLVMDAASILGKRQVIHPLWAIWPPFTIMFTYLVWKFVKQR